MGHGVWEREAEIASSQQISTSSQMMTVWEDENATAQKYPTKIKSMHVVCSHMCFASVSGYKTRSSCQSYWTRWVHNVTIIPRLDTPATYCPIVNTHNVPSTGSVINSQHLLCYATSPEKSETEHYKTWWKMKLEHSVVLKSCCWFPDSGVVPVAQLMWVVTCPLWTQSTDVPYITTRTSIVSQIRGGLDHTAGEKSVEKQVFLFKISR